MDGRPDVLEWTGQPLDRTADGARARDGAPVAETTGTDADWVVKLIDVYPDEDPVRSASMSGYELMVSADIFRGRYRESLEQARPIAASEPLAYEIPLPHAEPHVQAAGTG